MLLLELWHRNESGVCALTGMEVSPTEFERIGGRATTKKWKTSVRLLEEDGQAGQTLGDWLQVMIN